MKLEGRRNGSRLIPLVCVASVVVLAAVSMGVPEAEGGCGGGEPNTENTGSSQQAQRATDVADASVVPAQCTKAEIDAELASIKKVVAAQVTTDPKAGDRWAAGCATAKGPGATFCVGADNNCAGLGIGAIQNAFGNGPCGTVNPCVMANLQLTPMWPCVSFQQMTTTVPGGDHQVTGILGPDGQVIGYVDAWACTGNAGTVALVGDTCWKAWFPTLPNVSATSKLYVPFTPVTTRVTWFGVENQPCFSSGTCNAGLFCLNAVCRTNPTIMGFLPTSGPPGTVVTITGAGLGEPSDPRPPTVYFGPGTSLVNAPGATVAAGGTSVTAAVPPGAPTGPIAVQTVGGWVYTNPAQFTVTPAFSVTSFTPTSGAAGTTVTINGTDFQNPQHPITNVSFLGNQDPPAGSIQGATFSVVSPTMITAIVPAGATTGPLWVVQGSPENPGGVFQLVTTTAAFTVLPNPSAPEAGAAIPRMLPSEP